MEKKLVISIFVLNALFVAWLGIALVCDALSDWAQCNAQERVITVAVYAATWLFAATCELLMWRGVRK